MYAVMQIDLHGLTVNEALDVVESLLTTFKQNLHDKTRSQLMPCPRFFSLITGVGRHSVGGVPRIRPAVIKYLESNGYTFNETQAGVVVVKLRP